MIVLGFCVLVSAVSCNEVGLACHSPICLSKVSNQCMALVRDDCLVPTLDAPELGYIRESTNEQYVPDVLYKVMCIGEIFGVV